MTKLRRIKNCLPAFSFTLGLVLACNESEFFYVNILGLILIAIGTYNLTME